jgi:AcrR family transcriptional regulator
MARNDEIESKEMTRRKILDVARRNFALHGFEGASVEGIVKESGLSKGALYWHFPGKLELYREIMGEETRRIMQYFRVPEETKGHVDPVAFLVEKGKAMIDNLTENPESRLLWVDLTVVAQRGDSLSRNLAGEIIDSVLDSILPELDKAFSEKMPDRHSLSPRDSLLCLTHIFDGLAVNLGLRLKAEDAKRYWEIMVRMLLEKGCEREKP